MVKNKTKPETTEKKGRGRPPIEIDEALVYELACIMCTHREIAAVCKVSRSVITERFSDLIKDGHEVGKMSLRRKQWALADKSAAMAIFLGKNYLGQKDNVDFGDNTAKTLIELIHASGNGSLSGTDQRSSICVN